jgi:hypothetical protein
MFVPTGVRLSPLHVLCTVIAARFHGHWTVKLDADRIATCQSCDTTARLTIESIAKPQHNAPQPICHVSFYGFGLGLWTYAVVGEFLHFPSLPTAGIDFR